MTEGFKLYKHKHNDSVRFYARPVDIKQKVDTLGGESYTTVGAIGEYEIRAARNAAFDTEDRPLILTVPGGTFPARFFEETYELVVQPPLVPDG